MEFGIVTAYPPNFYNLVTSSLKLRADLGFFDIELECVYYRTVNGIYLCIQFTPISDQIQQKDILPRTVLLKYLN